MAKRVQLIQPETGLMKSGYYGFSWTFLFFGWFVPIFRGELFISLWHSPNSVDKYYCQNLNGRNANAKSQIHS
jgi:hypothetical protein